MKKILMFIFKNFGPLVAYYITNALFGFRIAIIVSIVVTVIEVVIALKAKQKLGSLFYVSAIITLLFGLLDLHLQNPYFIKYESVMTNTITGLFFLGTLWAEESVILDFIKKRNPDKIITGKTIFRTKVLTIVWASYFFLKAVIYFNIASRSTELEAVAFRTGVGSISFYVLLFLSIAQSRKIFDFLEIKGILITPKRYLEFIEVKSK